jgi:hypothetical protein
MKFNLENILFEKPKVIQKISEDTPFDADRFFGLWFMSKKKMIPRSWYEYLYKKYPYSGMAYRLDDSAYNGAYASWSKTLKGVENWQKTQTHLSPLYFQLKTFKGKIIKGVDFAKFVKQECIDGDSAKLIIDVEEVFPIEPVTEMSMAYF